MTKTPFSSPGILIHEFKSNAMFDEFINQILGDERVVVPSHQEKAEPDVIGKKTAENQEIKIPKKYQEDIQTLRDMYGESFKTVSIRQTTSIKPLYTTIATVTMKPIVAVAIVLLNLYVTACISY